MNDDELPTCEQLQAGIRAFEENEKRGEFYHQALANSAGWGQPSAMAAGIKLLLDAWHQAFYRFGAFDPQQLEQTIAANFVALDSITSFIATIQEADREAITQLFEAFLICPARWAQSGGCSQGPTPFCARFLPALGQPNRHRLRLLRRCAFLLEDEAPY